MSLPQIAIGTWFAARAERTPDRRALTFEGHTLSYRALMERADRLAQAFAASGVAAGNRIAFLGANQPAFVETLLATVRLGAVIVPLNHRLAAPELAFILGDAGPRLAVVDAEHRPTLEQADRLADSSLEIWEVGPTYDALIDDATPLDPAPTVDADDLAILMYTSGTTGRPKGVMLSHANLWWSNMNLIQQFDVHGDDVTLTMAPLFHIAGLNATTMLTWMKGGEVILHRAFDVDRVLDDIEQHGVNTLFGVPAMFGMLEQSPRFADADLSSVRMAICGGAPVSESLLRTYLERGITMQQGYGLTETSPAASFLSSEHALSKLGSAGKPPLYVELKIEADGHEVTEPHRRGEICLRGANITRGYWNRPDATDQAIDEDGWFHTGDIGYRDEDGFVFIVDRLKDMIISGGENVYPAEVENVLHAHPEILEVAVVGTTDEKWGEVVTAHVVTTPGSTLDLEGLRAFAGERLARYKLPRVLKVIPALPRGASGKVLKQELRAPVS